MNATRKHAVTLVCKACSYRASVLLIVLTAPYSWANDLDVRLSQLDEKTQHIRDVTANFQEKVFTAMLKKPLLSKGTIFIKGKRTHWKTTEPTAISLFMGDENITIYYAARKTVEIYTLDRHLRSLAISPLPKLITLRRYFTIELDPRNLNSPSDSLQLRLTPKDESVGDFIEELFVRIDERIGIANHVEMIDPDGDRTVITFTNIRTNVGVTNAQVKLHVPDDVTTVYPLGDRTESDSTKPKSQP